MANDYIFVLISKHSLVKINYWKVITWLAWWIIAKALFLVNYGWWKSLLLKSFFFNFISNKMSYLFLIHCNTKCFFYIYTVTYLYSFSVWLQCLCGLMILYHNIMMIVCMYVCVCGWVCVCMRVCGYVYVNLPLCISMYMKLTYSNQLYEEFFVL